LTPTLKVLQIFLAANGGSLSVVWDMELYENGEGFREKCNEMHCLLSL
jgi:hypothetical protein